MKNFLQAAALIVLTAGIVYAAAVSPRHIEDASDVCQHEWEQAYEKAAPAADKDSSPVAITTERK